MGLCRTRWLVLSAFFAHSFGQTVTLWQFGGRRLLGGPSTAPLQPLGTAEDGLSTTYLYQILKPVTTIAIPDNGLSTLTTIYDTKLRTIIVSESGWYEPFQTNAISCGFVNESFGQCMDINQKTTKIANSGRPTPVRIAVAVSQSMTSLPVSPTPGTLAGEDSEPTNVTVPAASSPSKKPPVGAIVGGLIGGFSVVLGLLFALWRCRRRRTSYAAEADSVAPRPYTTMYPEPNSASLLQPAPPSIMEYASVPASDWSRPSKEWQHSHDASASRSPTEALSHSDGAFSRSDVGLYHSDGAPSSVTDHGTLPPPPRYSRI